MMLFKLALRNIRKNSYDYLMYFFSMVFAIMIYGSFASIKYNESFTAAIGGSEKIASAFNAATVVMTIFCVVFIWYSNMFFTKKRKKEFGLYSLMGVKKNHIGRMYFYETILIGLVAIIVGSMLGTFFSKFFNMILVKVIGYDMNVEFFFSWDQVFETLKVFVVIFAVASFQGYYITYRYKLIDMFNSSNKKEKVPKSNNFLAVLSIIMIVGSYVLSHTYFFVNPSIGFLATLFLAITGTYIFFRHFILLGINLIKKNPKHYYKSVNMIATSLLFYRIKSNYRTLATIAIMSAVTLTTIGTAYSFYYQSYSSSKSHAPFSLTYVYKTDELDRQVEKIIQDAHHKILYNEKATVIKTPMKMLYEEALKKNELLSLNNFRGVIIPEMVYHRLIKNGSKDLDLGDNDSMLVVKQFAKLMERNYKGCTVNIENSDINFKIRALEIKPLFHSNIGSTILVVNDKKFEELKKTYETTTYSIFDFNNQRNSDLLSAELHAFLSEKSEPMLFYPEYISYVAATGLFVYIAGFLGIVFLIATGTIIFFKQLTEANDDWQKYMTLDKIGVTGSEMRLIVNKQMRLIFGMPVIIGIVHAFFAIDVLAAMLGTNLLIPVLMSFAAYLVIYLIFYFMTCSAYYKIIHSYKVA